MFYHCILTILRCVCYTCIRVWILLKYTAKGFQTFAVLVFSIRSRLVSIGVRMNNVLSGPEKQTEWSLFWWRLTLPFTSLLLCITIIALGQCSTILYGIVASCIWYFCNLVVMTYPFVVTSHFNEGSGNEECFKKLLKRDEESGVIFGQFGAYETQTFMWKRIGYVSAAISIVELLLCMDQPYVTISFRVSDDTRGAAVSHSQVQPMAWIIGNTLFGIIGFLTIPLLMRSSNRDSVHIGYQSYSLEVFDPQHHSGEMQYDEASSFNTKSRYVSVPDTDSKLKHSRNSSHSRLLIISAVCCALSWLVMFTMYSSNVSPSSRRSTSDSRLKWNPATGVIIWNEWFLLQLLSIVLCVVLSVLQYTKSEASILSFDYTVVYSTVLVHLPLFLGHLCVKLFLLAELEEEEQILLFKKYAGGSNISTGWVSTVKFGVSMLFLGLMQCYFHIMTQLLRNVAKPSDHPTFLYIGQLYYYMFWYILVSSETAIDGLYWAMLLLNNIHIAFLNTGIYSDVRNRASDSTIAVLSCLMATCTISQSRVCTMCFRPNLQVLKAFGQCKSFVRDSKPALAEMEDVTSIRDRAIGVSEKVGNRLRNSATCSRRNSAVEYEISSPLHSSPMNCENDKHITIRDNDINECPKEIASRNHSKIEKSHFCNDESVCFLTKPAHTARKVCSKALHAENASPSDHMMTDTHESLYFLMKLAEQDNMADTTALILVPTVMTILSIAATPSDSLTILFRRKNMWVRCICMFIGRLGSAFLAREIFAWKLRSRIRMSNSKQTNPRDDIDDSSSLLGTFEGFSARLWIQRLMVLDFHRQFGYFTAVTMIVTFACFERSELPIRFALLT